MMSSTPPAIPPATTAESSGLTGILGAETVRER